MFRRPLLLRCLVLLLSPIPAVLHAQQGHSHKGIWFGRSVLALQDLDGDGVRDLAVGAPAAPGAISNSGVVLVMSGATRAVLQEWRGEGLRESFGYSLRHAGDVNADGTGDVLVGYHWQARCEVRSGKDGALLLGFDRDSQEIIPFGDSNADGAADFLLVDGSSTEIRDGKTGSQLDFGTSLHGSGPVYPVGDLDGDLLTDFVLISDEPTLFLSAPAKDWKRERPYYYPAVNRKILGDLWPDVFRDRAESSNSLKESKRCVISAAPAGDLDGDGAPDILLFQSWWGSGVVLGLSLKSETPLFTIHGERGIGATSIAGHDLNADGHPDILLAKPASAFEISVRAHSGRDGKLLWKSDWSDRGVTTGLSLEVVVNAAGVDELLVGSSDRGGHGHGVCRVGELRQLSLATGKPLWMLQVEQVETLREAAREKGKAR